MPSLFIGIKTAPVYHLFMAALRQKTLSPAAWIWIIDSFTLAFALSLLTIALPMRFGEKRLTKRLI